MPRHRVIQEKSLEKQGVP